MPVPQIPLSGKPLEDLEAYISQQLTDIAADRQNLISSYADFTDAYDAKHDLNRTFPWKDASGVVLPLIPSHVDALKARILNTQFGQDPLAIFSAYQGEHVEFAELTQQFFDWVADQEVDFYAAYREAIPIMLKYGCVFIYIEQTNLPRKFMTFKDGEFTPSREDAFNKPTLRVIHPKDFYMPIHEMDPQTASIAGYGYKLNRGTFMEYAHKDVRYFRPEAADKMKALLSPIKGQGGQENEDRVQDARDRAAMVTRQVHADRLDMRHLYMRYDIDGDGLEEEIHVHWEATEGVIARVAYPHYKHRQRPFVKHEYESRDGEWAGMGIPEMLLGSQATMSTLMRQGIDNNTVKTTGWYTVIKGSGIKQNQHIHPARHLHVTSHEDIQERQFPAGQLNTSFEDIKLLQDWAERRTGISDFNLGQESGKKTTATTTLAVLQENNKKIDFVIRDVRTGFNEVIMQVLQLYQQFKPGIVFPVLGPEGVVVMQKWELTRDEDLRKRVLVNATASSAVLNKAVDRQEKSTLLNQLISVYDRKVQAASQVVEMQATAPQLAGLLLAIDSGTDEIMDRILDSFDMKQRREMLPSLEVLFGQAGPPIQPQQPGAPGDPGQQGQGGPVGPPSDSPQGVGVAPGPTNAPGRPSAGEPRTGGVPPQSADPSQNG